MSHTDLSLVALTIKGYRSVRQVFLPIETCTVFVGENGVGKTNLYRALSLLQAAARGTITRELAEEGGVESAFWAGHSTETALKSMHVIYRMESFSELVKNLEPLI